MNRVVLVTTQGCEACEIMKNSINQAIALTKKTIDFEVIDFRQLAKDFIRANNIKDFPTTVMYKGNIKTRKEIGTRPYIVVLRWFDIDFK